MKWFTGNQCYYPHVQRFSVDFSNQVWNGCTNRAFLSLVVSCYFSVPTGAMVQCTAQEKRPCRCLQEQIEQQVGPSPSLEIGDEQLFTSYFFTSPGTRVWTQSQVIQMLDWRNIWYCVNLFLYAYQSYILTLETPKNDMSRTLEHSISLHGASLNEKSVALRGAFVLLARSKVADQVQVRLSEGWSWSVWF